MANHETESPEFVQSHASIYNRMPENGDRDSIISLFEPLPPEMTEHFNNSPELSPPQRRETIQWLLSPEGGGVNVQLRKPYDNDETRERLVENMLLNSWFLPELALGNRIPLQGVSLHKVGSGTIPLTIFEDIPRRVDVVVKPFHAKHSKAERELTKLETVKSRGISTIVPFGTIDVNDSYGHDTYGLTILKKGIVPLQKIHFEQLQSSSGERFRQLTDLLQGLSRFIAKMHNSGVVHQDLHLGNVAIDLTQETPDEFIVFDLEKATIMALHDLGVKNKIADTLESAKAKRKFEVFERLAMQDVGNIAADIAVRNERISYDTILYNLVLPYLNARQKSHGRYSDEDFMIAFDQHFKKRSGKIKHFVDWERKHSSKLKPTDNLHSDP